MYRYHSNTDYCEFNFMKDHLDKVSLKEGDQMVLMPFLGRQRKIKINRTEIDFATDNIQNSDKSMTFYTLGRVGKEKLHFRLKRQEIRNLSGASSYRFILFSKLNTPFKLNGNYTFKSYLEQGDKIELGYNTLFVDQSFFEATKTRFSKNELRLVNSNIPVLLEGETGTGKTSLAKEIHRTSKENKNFVHLNLSSFSKNLIESELFGHVKGAFTGAVTDKEGAFKQAKGGTLFIDEIDSLPIELQTKLLIFLDEKKFRPVGASRDMSVECRLIFASGSRLDLLVKKGLMRKDFYYRLASGFKMELPALRSDEELIQKHCEKFASRAKVYLEPSLIEFYKTLPWPGNYRQLNNLLEKKQLLSNNGKLSFDHCDEMLMIESTNLIDINEHVDKEVSMEELKFHYVQKLLLKYNYNKSAVSKILGITARSVKNIYEKKLN